LCRKSPLPRLFWPSFFHTQSNQADDPGAPGNDLTKLIEINQADDPGAPGIDPRRGVIPFQPSALSAAERGSRRTSARKHTRFAPPPKARTDTRKNQKKPAKSCKILQKAAKSRTFPHVSRTF